jgi:hypothetical protein
VDAIEHVTIVDEMQKVSDTNFQVAELQTVLNEPQQVADSHGGKKRSIYTGDDDSALEDNASISITPQEFVKAWESTTYAKVAASPITLVCEETKPADVTRARVAPRTLYCLAEGFAPTEIAWDLPQGPSPFAFAAANLFMLDYDEAA